jgi:hypothetical protein
MPGRAAEIGWRGGASGGWKPGKSQWSAPNSPRDKFFYGDVKLITRGGLRLFQFAVMGGLSYAARLPIRPT